MTGPLGTRIAVTGGNGLLGSEVLRRLEGAHQLLAMGRGPSRRPPGRYRWQPADLGDGRSVGEALRAFRPELIVHCGAMTDVDGCERDPQAAHRVNVQGTIEVVQAAREVGARLLGVSTDYVFDGAAGPYGEEDAPNPISVYGRTKLEAERAILEAPRGVVARVAVLYGARRETKRTFATELVEALQAGRPVPAFEDQWVSPTFVGSCAEMLLELGLESDYRGVIHLAGAAVMTRLQFAVAVAKRFGLRSEGIVPIAMAKLGLPAARPLRGGLRTERAAEMLRARPLPLGESLDRFHAEWLADAADAAPKPASRTGLA
jgi:dTDP-4-dehydrorhamnose reductase